MRIADSKYMKALDEEAIRSGIPSMLLMERAAYGLVTRAESILGSLMEKKIAVFCGTGNNGGDGIAFSLFAQRLGADIRCFLTDHHPKRSGDPAAFLTYFTEEGGAPIPFDPNDISALEFTKNADLIVDAIFGIGFRGQLSGNERYAAQWINQSKAIILSADIPSGAEADSGLISEDCVVADYTVSFTMLKPAHCIQPAKAVCGNVSIWEIGIPCSITMDASLVRDQKDISLIDRSFICPLLPKRNRDTHKGDYGKVLVIGGSIGYTGAPFLAASAAFRAGSGLVYMAVPECIYTIEASKCNEIICMPFAAIDGGFAYQSLDNLIALAEKCDVCVIGPGLGRSNETDRLICALLEHIACPIVLDADGINAVSENIHVLSDRAAQNRITVLTPHDVEFSRLGGTLSSGRIRGASELSGKTGAVVVLKGNTTVTALPDGSVMINTTGNPGMAKGGSGDLLTGVIASWIGQGFEVGAAAAGGVFIHGAAGDLAAHRYGEYGMLPTDMLLEIPTTLKNGGLA